MASTPAVPGNVERAQPRHDLVARLRSGYIGTVRKLADRPNQRVAINPRLPRAEILGCPLEDVSEVELRDRAEAYAPRLLDHGPSFARAGNNSFGEVIQVSLEFVDAVELLELASIQCVEAGTRR